MLDSDTYQTMPVVAREPVLGLPHTLVEAGDVRQGRRVEMELPVSNYGAGGTNLVVQAQCEAEWITLTQGELSVPAEEVRCFELVLAPDETVPSGDFEVPVTIKSPNAVMQDDASVTVRGRVVEEIVLQAYPPEINFGEIQVGVAAGPITIKTARSDGKPAHPQVDRVHAEPGLAQSVKWGAQENEVEVTVETANREEGTSEFSLVVADADPHVRAVEIPMNLQISDATSLECPGSCDLRTELLIGESTIRLTNPGTVPVQVYASTEAEWLSPREGDALTVNPKSSADLLLDYDLRQVRNIKVTSWVDLHITTDAGRTKRRRIEVSVERAAPALEASIRRRIGTVVEGKPKNVEIVLENQGDGEAIVTLKSKPDWLTVENQRLQIGPHSTQSVRATILMEADPPPHVTDKLAFVWNGPPDRSNDVAIDLVFDTRRLGAEAGRTTGAGRGAAGRSQWGIVVAVLLIAVGALLWWSINPPQPDTPVVTVPEPPIEPKPPTEPEPTIDPRLQEGKDLKREADVTGNLSLTARAADLFQMVLDEDADSEEAMWWLAWCLADLGRDDEAIKAFSDFIQLSSDSGRIQEAIEAAKRRMSK